MEVLRTPDERFAGLPDFPFEPHYLNVQTKDGTPLRMHYLDEGPREGKPIVMLHGQPSWSYLYRRLIPGLAEAGFRVLAPDLIGFGRSDKPADTGDYSYSQHVEWVSAWLASVAPTNATFFVHDWGSMIGLRTLPEHGVRFTEVIVSNGGLPDCERLSPLEIFYTWRQFVRDQQELHVGNVVQLGSATELTEDVVAAYDAPFPDEPYKSAVRAFPELVPTAADQTEARANGRAWQFLEQWDKPFLTLFGEGDPINHGADKIFQKRVPGAAGQPHQLLSGAGHFIQEDAPDALVEASVTFARS
jgi:haloalkane dehalogenase